MTFQEFLELEVSNRFITLDDFYRKHLYLRTLAEYFYGDKAYRSGSCIFTKDSDFIRSRPTDDNAFKSNYHTVLFRKDQTVIFFDSKEALDLYTQTIDSSDLSHYDLSKDEIVMMIEEDLDSQIDGVEKVIEDYKTQIKLHQNRVDYLDQMKINLRKSATLEDIVKWKGNHR